MQKTWTGPFLAVLAGAGGAVLRSIQGKGAFWKQTLSYPAEERSAILLAALSAIVLIIAVLLSFRNMPKSMDELSYRKCFGCERFASFAVSSAGGAAVTVGAVLLYLSGGIGVRGAARLIFIFFAAITGVFCIILAKEGFTRRESPLRMLAGAVPTFFFCFWLAALYRENSSSAISSSYYYECLALIACTLSLYYEAGFIFGRTSPRRLFISHIAALFFLPIFIAGGSSLAEKVMAAGTLVFLFINTVKFLEAASGKTPQKRAKH